VSVHHIGERVSGFGPAALRRLRGWPGSCPRCPAAFDLCRHRTSDRPSAVSWAWA